MGSTKRAPQRRNGWRPAGPVPGPPKLWCPGRRGRAPRPWGPVGGPRLPLRALPCFSSSLSACAPPPALPPPPPAAAPAHRGPPPPPPADESQTPPAPRRRAKERVIQESLLPEAPQQYELPPITLLGELSKNARGLRSP